MNPFSSIPAPRIKRNKFKLDHENFFSTGLGLLTPTLVLDCVPGDSIKIDMAHLYRSEPLLSPSYGTFDVIHDFYKVPYRLLTSRKTFEQFFTGGVTGDVELNFPYFTLSKIFENLIYFLFVWQGEGSAPTGVALWQLLDNEGFFDIDFSSDSTNDIYDIMNNLDLTTELTAQEVARYFRYFSFLLDNLGYPVLKQKESNPLIANLFNFLTLEDGVYVLSEIANSHLNAIPLLAYLRIFGDNYIDQNLDSENYNYLLQLFDGDLFGSDVSDVLFANDGSLLNSIFYRCFRKNYITSVLPNSQRGTAINIPLGQFESSEFKTSNYGNTELPAGATPVSAYVTEQGSESGKLVAIPEGDLPLDIRVTANLSPVAITALRVALKLQQWLEKNNVAGSRYIEHILAHFGVSSSDKTIQRPEYLGGSICDLGISVVENQTEASASSPLGSLAGRGTSSSVTHLKHFECEEHCIVIGITTLMPRPVYSQAYSRYIFKQDKFDLFYPEFQHIGEQEVKKYEVFLNSNNLSDTYGYQQRYGEYKFMRNEVHGFMRSKSSYFLPIFPSVSPEGDELNLNKIQCHPVMFRNLFNYTGLEEGTFTCYQKFKISANREMSFYSMPQLT